MDSRDFAQLGVPPPWPQTRIAAYPRRLAGGTLVAELLDMSRTRPWRRVGRANLGLSRCSAILVYLFAAACSFRVIDDGPVASNEVDGGGATTATGGSTGAVGGTTGTGGGPSGGSGGTSSGGSPSCASCATGDCRCVPAPEAGWRAAVFAENSDGPVACPAGYSQQIVVGKGAQDTGCASCQCSQPSTTPCRWHWSSTSSCALQHPWGGWSNTLSAGICHDTNASQTVFTRVSVEGTSTKEPQCGAGSSAPNAPKYQTTATLCIDSSATACGSGVCAASPPSSFSQAACVVANQEGPAQCPAGYPVQRIFATGFSDQRTCSGCSCTLNTACTGGGIQYCSGKGCTGCSSSVPWDKCTQTFPASIKIVSVGSPPTQVCAPSGSPKVSGSLNPTGTRVVCCDA